VLNLNFKTGILLAVSLCWARHCALSLCSHCVAVLTSEVWSSTRQGKSFSFYFCLFENFDGRKLDQWPRSTSVESGCGDMLAAPLQGRFWPM
jgi:hypothetical protein